MPDSSRPGVGVVRVADFGTEAGRRESESLADSRPGGNQPRQQQKKRLAAPGDLTQPLLESR